MRKIINKINQWRMATKQSIMDTWYGTNNKMYKTNVQEIEDILHKNFPTANLIFVEDKSGGCASLFEVYVESKEFKNMTVLDQHRLIYRALHDKLKVIHGLRVITRDV